MTNAGAKGKAVGGGSRALTRAAERLGYPGVASWLQEATGHGGSISDRHAIARLEFFMSRSTQYCAVARAVGRGQIPLQRDGTAYKDVKDAKARARRHLQYFVLGRVPTGRWDTSQLLLSLLADFRLAVAHDSEMTAATKLQLVELGALAEARNRAVLVGDDTTRSLSHSHVLDHGERAVYVACDSMVLHFAALTATLPLKIGDTRTDVWNRVLQLNAQRTGRSSCLVVLRVYRGNATQAVSDWEHFHKHLRDRELPAQAGPSLGKDFRWTTLAELDSLAIRAGLEIDDLAVAQPRVIVPAVSRGAQRISA